MSNQHDALNRTDSSDPRVEKNIRESVDILKNVMESRFNRLSQANRRLKRKIFDLYTIFELSRRLNSVLDLDVLLKGMLSALKEELKIENISVFLRRDNQPDELSCFKLPTENPEAEESKAGIHACDDIEDYRISPTGRLSRYLLSQKEPLFLKEIQDHLPEDDEEIKVLHQLDCKLLVPLISRDKLIGILSLGPKRMDQRITDNDLEFISVFAGQVTVSVENALLYENQKRINTELRDTQKQLIQSEKLAATGQFSASLAHEINNPLGIIKNYLQILAESPAGVEASRDQQANLDAIKEEVDRIARIVKSFLDFSRPAKEEMNFVDLNEIIRQVIFLVHQEFLSQGVKITTDLPESLPQILGSEDQLKQVFLNLLVNSRDSMPGGGSVSIRVEETGKRVEIEISDTGCGISEENINRIFDPFFTTKTDGKGTGLGLWICYGIIQRHGGAIQAHRQKQGTSFTVTLPTK
jgi:signal transduction histidine kinase